MPVSLNKNGLFDNAASCSVITSQFVVVM